VLNKKLYFAMLNPSKRTRMSAVLSGVSCATVLSPPMDLPEPQNPLTQLSLDYLHLSESSSHKFSASKIDQESYKDFCVLPGAFQDYFFYPTPICAGSVKLVYEGFNAERHPFIISEFRSWQRPDGETVDDNWAELYSTDKKVFDKAKDVPGVVPLYDFAEYRVPEGFRQFVVTERCECDLKTYLNQSERPLVDFASQLMQIVQKAHANGLVIGDLTLNNLLVKDGKIYLSDLDLIYLCDSDTPKKMKTLGTVDFLPPESFCLAELPFDPFKKDLWALGIALAYLMDDTPNKIASEVLEKTLQLDGLRIFANKKPSKIKSLNSSLCSLRHNKIQELSYYSEAFKNALQEFYQVSQSLGTLSPVIQKLMNADPKKRYQNIDEALSAWNDYHPSLDDSLSLSTSSDS
jgi:serine/threonine protein kinase